MNDATTAFGLRPVPDGQGGTRLEFGPMPPPKSGSKGTGKLHTPAPIIAERNAEQLRLFIERVERLEEEETGIKDDKREVFSEAKSQGYDTRQMKKIIAMRKLDPNDRAEAEAILETYMIALGLA